MLGGLFFVCFSRGHLGPPYLVAYFLFVSPFLHPKITYDRAATETLAAI